MTLTIDSTDSTGRFYVEETSDDKEVTDITPSSLSWKKVTVIEAWAKVSRTNLADTKVVRGTKWEIAMIFEVEADEASMISIDEIKAKMKLSQSVTMSVWTTAKNAMFEYTVTIWTWAPEDGSEYTDWFKVMDWGWDTIWYSANSSYDEASDVASDLATDINALTDYTASSTWDTVTITTKNKNELPGELLLKMII